MIAAVAALARTQRRIARSPITLAAAALPHSLAACSSIATPVAAFANAPSAHAAPASARGFHSTALAAAPTRRPSASKSSTPEFTPQPRRTNMDPLGGDLAAPSTAGLNAGLSLPELSRAVELSPQTVSRGRSAKAAKMERELHASSNSKLNHSLAYYIDRSRSWNELVPLLFQHMHHMSTHNWIRGAQRLVALSPSRPLLDSDLYTQFGRYMVQLETQLSSVDDQGLMRLIFVPYHYLKQCLVQMRLAQEAALKEARADPVGAALKRKAARMAEQTQKEQHSSQSLLDQQLEEQQSALSLRSHSAHARSDDKSKKMRAREHRAGRVFTSVAHTIKQRATDKGKSARKLSGRMAANKGKNRPGRVW